MVDNKYLREYAEKAYLQYPGYSLEKARINFPIYYPSIANYYLQFKAKQLEVESLNNRNVIGITLAIEIVDKLQAVERKLELLNQRLINQNIDDPKQRAFSQFINKAAVPLMAAGVINALADVESSLSRYGYLAKSFRSRLGIKQLTDKFTSQIKQLNELTITK